MIQKSRSAIDHSTLARGLESVRKKGTLITRAFARGERYGKSAGLDVHSRQERSNAFKAPTEKPAPARVITVVSLRESSLVCLRRDGAIAERIGQRERDDELGNVARGRGLRQPLERPRIFRAPVAAECKVEPSPRNQPAYRCSPSARSTPLHR